MNTATNNIDYSFQSPYGAAGYGSGGVTTGQQHLSAPVNNLQPH